MPRKMPHENGDGSTMVGRPLRRENPHKYLLYKPTFSQVIMFLSSGNYFPFILKCKDRGITE